MAKPHCSPLTQEALIQALEGLLGVGDEAAATEASPEDKEAALKLLKPHAPAIIAGLQRVMQGSVQQAAPKRPTGAAQRMKVQMAQESCTVGTCHACGHVSHLSGSQPALWDQGNRWDHLAWLKWPWAQDALILFWLQAL